MRIYVVSLLLLLGLAACQNTALTEATSNTKGETFDTKEARVFDEALAQEIMTQEAIHTIIKGEVESVCQMSGCWANLKSKDGNSEMFIQFKDAAFTVPNTITGKQLTMKGKAYKLVTSVEELKHNAKEEGLPQAEIDAITQAEEELRFLASGVSWE